MILGIGNDIVDITRIEKALARHKGRFEERCFTPIERAKAESRRGAKTHTQTYAKRFAAKEACAKALGCGIAKGISWQDIGVVNDDEGRPSLELSGEALECLERLTPAGMEARVHLSLSDEPPLAQAFVIIEAH